MNRRDILKQVSAIAMVGAVAPPVLAEPVKSVLPEAYPATCFAKCFTCGSGEFGVLYWSRKVFDNETENAVT